MYGQEPGIVAAKPTDGISVEIEGGFMVPYVATIPGTDVQFEMIPVPGGTFKLGATHRRRAGEKTKVRRLKSPATVLGRKDGSHLG